MADLSALLFVAQTINALKGQTRDRNLEFATLVGKDGAIMANAYNDRSGEAAWDPAVGLWSPVSGRGGGVTGDRDEDVD
jgi:hypothetical protein